MGSADGACEELEGPLAKGADCLDVFIGGSPARRFLVCCLILPMTLLPKSKKIY